MPSLKKLTKELRHEIVSYLFPPPPPPPISKNLAFRLAILIFPKTRFCSHINFIGLCLHSKVIPKGFRSNFHASSLSHCNQYLRQIQCAQNSFSRNIMRITIRAMCQKHDGLDKQILQCRSELSKIQKVNSKLFNHLHQIKAHKCEQLTSPPNSCDSSLESLNTVVTIPENLPLSDAEKSVLSRALILALYPKNLTNSRLSKMLKNFFAAFNLKPFSMTKRMILTPRTKIFSRRFILENRSGLPHRASLPP